MQFYHFMVHFYSPQNYKVENKNSCQLWQLIGRVKLLGFSASNQKQGGKNIYSPLIYRLPTKRRVLQRAVGHLGALIRRTKETN